jgi:ABC-type transport system involved in multi-copper enzyme maturation permease subunit
MRAWRTASIVCSYVTVLGLVAIGFLVQQGGPASGSSSQVGVQLFQVLALIQVLLLLFIAPLSTAGAISGERQRQTWDLLLTTRLTPGDIVWGKLLTGLVFDVLLVIASLPLFGLAFLFGGIDSARAIHVYAVFLATAVVLSATGLFVSSLTRRQGHSMMIANLVAAAVGLGLTLVTLYFEDWGVQATGPSGALPLPPLTPLAQLDPVVAVASALPAGSGGSMLGGLDHVRHAFGLPLELPVWAAYCIIVLLLSVFLVSLTSLSVRRSLLPSGKGTSR